MKLRKDFKASNKYGNLEISIKLDSTGFELTKEESIRHFDYFIDRIIDALLKDYHYSEVKEIKHG